MCLIVQSATQQLKLYITISKWFLQNHIYGNYMLINIYLSSPSFKRCAIFSLAHLQVHFRLTNRLAAVDQHIKSIPVLICEIVWTCLRSMNYRHIIIARAVSVSLERPLRQSSPHNIKLVMINSLKGSTQYTQFYTIVFRVVIKHRVCGELHLNTSRSLCLCAAVQAQYSYALI